MTDYDYNYDYNNDLSTITTITSTTAFPLLFVRCRRTLKQLCHVLM